VTVEANGLNINTTDASVSTIVDRKFVENIPLNGRSFQDLISMTPGVVTQSPQNTNQFIAFSVDFSVNGQRTESNYYTVDGVTGNTNAGVGGGSPGPANGGSIAASTALGTTQTLISVDALEEFRVQSSTYSAEFGRTPGGQRSGYQSYGEGHLSNEPTCDINSRKPEYSPSACRVRRLVGEIRANLGPESSNEQCQLG
jgi:hypothetical protein